MTSISTTVVSWAETCSDSCIRVAIVRRRRLSFSVLPRSGEDRLLPLQVPRWRRPPSALLLQRAWRRGVEDVLLADASADAGAGHRGQIDAVLLGELAHDRCDVRVGRHRTRPGALPVPVLRRARAAACDSGWAGSGVGGRRRLRCGSRLRGRFRLLARGFRLGAVLLGRWEARQAPGPQRAAGLPPELGGRCGVRGAAASAEPITASAAPTSAFSSSSRP